MKCLLRELVLVRLDRASLSLADAADDTHASLLTNVLEEGERTLARTRHSWHHHGGRLDSTSVTGFMASWRRLVIYERKLWGPGDDPGLLSPVLD